MAASGTLTCCEVFCLLLRTFSNRSVSLNDCKHYSRKICGRIHEMIALDSVLHKMMHMLKERTMDL